MAHKTLAHIAQNALLPFSRALLYLWGNSMRVQYGEEHSDLLWTGEKSVIFAFWHSQLLMMPRWFQGCRAPETRAHVLVSQSRDGELISRILGPLGVETVRGSSSRGGREAFATLQGILERGEHVAITPDGPKGPARKIKQGVLKLAQLSECPIIALGWHSSRCYRLRSWDQMQVPLPFSKLYFQLGNPLFVPKDCSEAELALKGEQLESELNRVSVSAPEDSQ